MYRACGGHRPRELAAGGVTVDPPWPVDAEAPERLVQPGAGPATTLERSRASVWGPDRSLCAAARLVWPLSITCSSSRSIEPAVAPGTCRLSRAGSSSSRGP